MPLASHGCKAMSNFGSQSQGFGSQSMVAPLRRVLMKRPGAVMAGADAATWNYAGALELEALQQDHDALVAKITAAGTEVVLLGEDPAGLADAVFTHDPSQVTREGAIILRMGKELRRDEADVHARFYERQDIPILGTIEAPGTVEAGDCVWLDEQTLLMAMGYRTNEAGIAQMAEIVAPLGVKVHAYDMSVYQGAQACLHLMSIISMLAHDLALVYRSLLPVRIVRLFEERGIEMIETPTDEFESSGTLSGNVLTLAPRKCLTVDGFHRRWPRCVRRAAMSTPTAAMSFA